MLFNVYFYFIVKWFLRSLTYLQNNLNLTWFLHAHLVQDESVSRQSTQKIELAVFTAILILRFQDNRSRKIRLVV